MLVPTTFSERLANDLLKAVDSGSIDEVISLLDKRADPNHQLYWSEEWISKRRLSPLLTACSNHNLEMVKVLIQRGADVDKTCGSKNLTPLHVACLVGFKEGVEYLIVEARSKVGELIYPLNDIHAIKPFTKIISPTLTICTTTL